MHQAFVTFSRNVFIPLTNICRNKCGYCGFRREIDHPEARLLSPDEVGDILERGARTGCSEALFTFGERPEEVEGFNEWLKQLGYKTIIEYLEEMCRLSISIGLLPHSNAGILERSEFKKLKSYEDSFPNFLRDLAEGQKAGLTLMQALQTTSKSQYGLLTSEIRRLYNQLTWNIPIEEVLKSFSLRMKKSKTIVRAMMIIDQATKSGGNVEDTMESLASNIESLKEVQEEKSTLLNQQVIMMYAIFFIFLGITVILIKFLVKKYVSIDLRET